MSTVFARCTALGLFAGGFALTGDLGWVAERGMRVLNARSIPAEENATAPAAEPAAAPHEGGAPIAGPAAPPAEPQHDPAAVFQGSDVRPPSGGPGQVAVATLAAGNRIVVWTAGPPGLGSRAWRCIVLDVVDPAAAEALLYEAVSFSSAGEPIATAAAPRRVMISGPAGGVLVRGQSFGLRSLGVATPSGGGVQETVGPVVALAIVREG